MFSACEEEKEVDDRPNIIIIMADDMGYSDIGCYGSEIPTPNIDNLAKNGIKFRSFYNTSRCCPTRASLLTGLYPHQVGMGGMVSKLDSEPNPGPYQGFLNDRSVTIAEVLKEAGYSTYMSGKWHVGEKQEHWPRQRGFDKYFGLISGASSYFEIIKNQDITRQMAMDDELWEPDSDDFYMTDAFTDQALEYIEGHYNNVGEGDQANPFFLYLSYTAPHWPLHAKESDIARFEGYYDVGWDELRDIRYERMLELGVIGENHKLSERPERVPAWASVQNKGEWARKMQVYAAMVNSMDQGIGKVIRKLEEAGDLDNTIIMFLSDNGGCAENVEGRGLNDPEVPIGQKGSYVAYDEPWAMASNTPFRKYKSWVHEGGIATPFVMQWPKVLKGGDYVTNQVGHVVDLMATCLDAAKADYPEVYKEKEITPLEGESILPILLGQPEFPRTLFWEHQENKGARDGNWKIVSDRRVGEWELYNLEKDPTEMDDLAANEPERLKSMISQYENWAQKIGVENLP